MFLISPWFEIDFHIGHFADFEQSKVDSHSTTLGKWKLTLLVYFIDFGQVSYFTEFEQDVGQRKTIQTPSAWQKIQEPHTRSGTSHFFFWHKYTSKMQSFIPFRNTVFWFL